MVQFTVQIDKDETIVIASDGGVATILHADPSSVCTTYYQTRVERLAHDVKISDEEWEELAEGKAYHKDWDATSLNLDMIKDAICWLMMGAGASFPNNADDQTHEIPTTDPV
jgi:hypothetical protein